MGKFSITPEQGREANKSDEPVKGKKRAEDPRFWKPRLSNTVTRYDAKVRPLTQGMAGIQDPSMPWAIEQKVHYIKEPQHRLFLTVKCRETLGEKCPICEAIWATYNAILPKSGKEEAKKILKRLPSTGYIGNVLIVDDLNNPELNGEVKMWDHSNAMHKTLDDPMQEPKEVETDVGFKKPEEKEIFTPYSPEDGRNYVVVVEKNTDNPAIQVTYKNSFWDDAGNTPIAEDEEGIMAILDRCYDLNEFLTDVPTADELIKMYNAFNAKVADAITGGGAPAVGDAQVPDASAGNANVAKGDSKAYFGEDGKGGKDEKSAPAETKAPTEAKTETAVADAPAGSTAPAEEDDDLPF